MKYLLLAVFLLAGCNTVPFTTYSLSCLSKQDCAHKWSEAITWTVEKAPYKIHIQTENLIQTYGPFEEDSSAGIEITREENSDGSGEIELIIQCNIGIEIPSCSPDPTLLSQDFSYWINQ